MEPETKKCNVGSGSGSRRSVAIFFFFCGIAGARHSICREVSDTLSHSAHVSLASGSAARRRDE